MTKLSRQKNSIEETETRSSN